ncbi:MAG: SIS domain-containing protein [Nanoarchaeota archaeon]|nr:SIS domain-containing protein [Nanoarchaeota archaeon]
MEKEILKQKIDESISAINYLKEDMNKIYEFADTIYSRLNQGNKILIFGNGGSAADSQHIAAELVGRFSRERKGASAIALTTDSSILTAIGNDYGFENIFARQVEAHAKLDDILWGISTSGNSENVIKAFKKGKEIGTYNMSFTGRDSGIVGAISDFNLNIPVQNTARIQEAHLVAYHLICDIVEENLLNN